MQSLNVMVCEVCGRVQSELEQDRRPWARSECLGYRPDLPGDHSHEPSPLVRYEAHRVSREPHPMEGRPAPWPRSVYNAEGVAVYRVAEPQGGEREKTGEERRQRDFDFAAAIEVLEGVRWAYDHPGSVEEDGYDRMEVAVDEVRGILARVRA